MLNAYVPRFVGQVKQQPQTWLRLHVIRHCATLVVSRVVEQDGHLLASVRRDQVLQQNHRVSAVKVRVFDAHEQPRILCADCAHDDRLALEKPRLPCMPDWPVPQAPSPALVVRCLEDALVELVEKVALLI